jgi:nuclear factor NF-kappa-B p105 subunit
MLFVSKVDKKNIKIRFFEEDDAGNIIWEDFGEFSENNVHHQYGISFKTPAYRNPNISSDVEVGVLLHASTLFFSSHCWVFLQVFYQLIRPKDKACSELKTFIYHPCKNPFRKKRKLDVQDELLTVNPCTTPSLERYLGEDVVSLSS